MTTTILEPKQGSPRLGVGLDASRRPANPEAWKRALGTNSRVTARFATLPDSERRWNVFGISAGAQILFLSFLLMLPLFFPERLKTSLHYDVMAVAAPLTEVPVAPPPPPPPKIKPKLAPPEPELKPDPAPEPPKLPKFVAPKPVQPLQPKPKTLEAKQPEIKPVFEEAKLNANSKIPKRPREEVKVGNISSGSAAPATVNLPVNKVQTGGFGDTNGIPGPADPNKRPNANMRGSPYLPGGPGYGNGTGGANGARGTVASTGFGNGTAVPPPSGGKRGSVQSTGFGNAAVVAEAPRKKEASVENPATPVDILEKPRPVYTAEGRTLRIEGDVVLEMVFLASGQVQVNRVISGLGHGLDETAMQAAKQIKFKPAKRDGQPVDFPARVRIEFRLAY